MKNIIHFFLYFALLSLYACISSKGEKYVKDEIILSPDIAYRKGFSESEKAYFRIELENTKQINILIVYFTILSGNADMYIYSDNEHKNLIEKKNFRYAYKKEVIEISEDILEKYYISLVLHESSYIEIKYDININEKENVLLNNEVNIEYLNKNQDYKNYTIKTESESNYLFIKTLDCSLTYLTRENEEKNITWKYYEFSGKEFKFNLKLDNYFNTVPDDKGDCTIFISTGTLPTSINSPLLIHENVPDSSSFINTYYNFPFIYNKESFKGILIKIELDSKSLVDSGISPEVKLTIVIGEQKADYETHIIHKSKLFYIKSNIEKYCQNKNNCNLQIQLEKQDSSSENNTYIINTSVNLLSSSTPIYVNKNQVYNEKILASGEKYFYTKIDENEEGEINIMFNKGSGKIFAKIVENKIIEENPNWNRRIQLPEEKSENLLEFDCIKGSLKYYTKNYNNCANGCELYILVKGYENTENEYNEFNEFSFSIDKKRKDINENGVTNLILNNYIKGNLTKNIYKYYTFTIDFNIKKISINFYSTYGRLYIKLGKGHIANEKTHDWELIRKSDGYNRIIISCDDEKIGTKSLKDISFSLGIIPSDSYIDESNINTYYFLQVQTLHNDIIDYYYLQSERSIICNTNEYEYCYVLLPLSEIDDNRNTAIYASSITNEDNKINIITKFYAEDEIDNIPYTESLSDKFPTQYNADQNSKGEKYLLLDNNKIDQSNYVLLTIDANEKNNLIKIVVSPPSNLIRTSLPPFTERLIYINPNKKIDFTILDNNHPSQNYYLNVKTVAGIAELFLGENDYYSEIDGNYINEISPDYKNPMTINNGNSNEEPAIIIISFTQRRNDVKEYDLFKNINNEISFSLSENPFPQYGFVDMKDKNIIINIYFYDIIFSPYGRSRITQNLFNVYAMLLPDYEDTFDVPGNYLIYENVGIIDLKLNKGKLRDGGYYVYTFIEKSYGNDNNYKKIKEQITVSEIDDNNEIKIFPKSKYFYSLDNDENAINLLLTNRIYDNKIFLIDIAQEIPILNNLNYTIKNNKNEIITNYKIYEYLGKTRILIDLLENNNDVKNNDIKLIIEKNDNNTIPTNFTFQYYTYSSQSSIIEYDKFDNNYYIEEIENRKNIIFKNIQHFYNNTISNVIYFINIYNKTDDFNTTDKLDTVFLGNNNHKDIVFSNIIDWLKPDYETYSQYIPSDLNYTKDQYMIRIVAAFINDKVYEERIIYKMKEEKKKKSSNSSWATFIFLIIGIIAVAAIFMFIIYIKKKSSKNKENITNEKIEPISNLEDSKNDSLVNESANKQ